MDRKVSTVAGRALYRLRSAFVEPVLGQLKDARDVQRFSLRCKAAAASEWKLLMGTHNLLKLYRRARAESALAPWWRRLPAAVTA
jgi:hypothetical protein